jgi:SAM-dependent methyltransferase
MSAPFIVIDTYTIKEGRVEDFRQFLQELFKVLEANEPGVLAVNAYLNEGGTEAAIVQLHPDAASVQRFWRVLHQHSGRTLEQFAEAATGFQVFGTPSDVILRRARQHGEAGVIADVKPEHLAGFTRLAAGDNPQGQPFGPNPLWPGGGRARQEAMEGAYQGTPVWDIGRAQPEVVRLEEAGEIVGSVLDVGCGTGENALYLCERRHQVVGVDAVPSAVDQARAKAERRGLPATFQVADALELDRLGRTFDTVLDCGLFHCLSDEERGAYARSLTNVVAPGGTVYILCFSERAGNPGRARRVSQAEIRATFDEGWNVASFREARLEGRHDDFQERAWLAGIVRSRPGAR